MPGRPVTSVTDHRRPGLPAAPGRDEPHRAPDTSAGLCGVLAAGPNPLPARRRGDLSGPLARTQPCLGLVIRAARRARAARWTTRHSRTAPYVSTRCSTRRAGNAGPSPRCRGPSGSSTRPRSPTSTRCPRCRSARTSRPRPPRQRRPAAGAARRGPPAEPQPRRLRQPAGTAHHHPHRSSRAGEQLRVQRRPARRRDPISVIRVRVAGVTGAEPSLPRTGSRRWPSRSRCARISTSTSSPGHRPRPPPSTLPAGQYGQPALTLHRGLGQEGRRGRHPDRDRHEAACCCSSSSSWCARCSWPTRPPLRCAADARNSGSSPAWAGPGPACSPWCSASWR